jgi:hypothetical protein
VYDEAIKNVATNDLRRNEFKRTRLYEYNEKGS